MNSLTVNEIERNFSGVKINREIDMLVIFRSIDVINFLN